MKLEKSHKQLRGPNSQPLEVCGHFVASLAKGNQAVEEVVYVVRGLSHPLVGKPAISGLQLVAVVRQVEAGATIRSRYTDLFNGLGKTKREYHIVLKENTQPYV